MAHRTLRFLSTALEGIPFHVRSIERTDEPHGLFRFDVELTIGGEQVAGLREPERSLLTSRVTLVYEEPGAEPRSVHGMIAARSQVERAGVDGVSLHLTIRPRIWQMTSIPATETSRDLAVPEILAVKLGAARFKEGEDFVVALRDERRKLELPAQRGESELDLVCRLCEHMGIQISFDHSSGRDVVVFSDGEGGARFQKR